MIKPSLLAELECIIPGEGYHAPQATRPVDADERPLPREIEGLHPHQAPTTRARKQRRPEWRTPTTMERMAIVLEAVRQGGPCTAHEVLVRVRVSAVKVTRGQVDHALRALEHERKVSSVVLRSARDAERAGGRRLWEVRR